MTNRRQFLEIGATAALSTMLWPRGFAPAPLRILILGGTGFVGPHIVHAALQRGHHVSMLNRGQRIPNQNGADFSKVEAVVGDRSQPTAYDNLKGKTWDVVI